MGRMSEEEDDIPLSTFLCKLRTPKNYSKENINQFDCDKGCVEYLVYFHLFIYIN
jgi:hypothetical protein